MAELGMKAVGKPIQQCVCVSDAVDQTERNTEYRILSSYKTKQLLLLNDELKANFVGHIIKH